MRADIKRKSIQRDAFKAVGVTSTILFYIYLEVLSQRQLDSFLELITLTGHWAFVDIIGQRLSYTFYYTFHTYK